MTEPEHQVCREYLGPDRGDCGKPATHHLTGPNLKSNIYKCPRHAHQFVKRNPLLAGDPRYSIKALA